MIARSFYWGVAKSVRHKVLILACAGSSPATPAKLIDFLIDRCLEADSG